MVDFKPEDVDLYLPHNLSNEDYHDKVHKATTVFERLRRQYQTSAQGLVHVNSATTEASPVKCVTMEIADTKCQKQGVVQVKDHQSTEEQSEKAVPTSDKSQCDSGYFASKSLDSEAKHKQEGDTGVVSVTTPLDKDIQFFLPLGSPEDEPDERLCVSPPLCDKDMAEGGERSNSQTDLSSYLKDLSLQSPGVAGSESGDTVFSDDYTVMTENGSDQGDVLNSDDGGRRLSGASSDTDSAQGSVSTVDENDVSFSKNGGPKSSTPLPQGKGHRPDIKLLLSQPPIDLDDWADTPSCSLETTPESPEERPVVCENDSNFYEDREFDFLRTEPVKRSTSLKTYKTPPGTPHRKKAVRFADALGLDLESVRHILNLEEPPKVPASAMKDLHTRDDDQGHIHKASEGVKYLSLNFPQPGASPTFFQRVQGQKVLLENCIVDDKNMNITGTVRVANIAFHKKVQVRFTVNNWLTHTDVHANYVQNSNDGPTDRFSFSLSVPDYFSIGSRLQFCIMFQAGGTEHWDSNYGNNYVIECYAKAAPVSDADSSWLHFL